MTGGWVSALQNQRREARGQEAASLGAAGKENLAVAAGRHPYPRRLVQSAARLQLGGTFPLLK